jgi:methylmalonyl-CoA/ethylmalonyl-CoA epimerase
MKINKVEHIGTAVNDLEDSLKFYTEVMGVKPSDISTMEVPGVVKGVTILSQGSAIELLQFMDAGDPLYKYVDKQTDIIHHYGINVENIVEILAAVKKAGGTVIHETPMQMPGGRKFAFIIPPHSKVLIELLETKRTRNDCVTSPAG